MKNYCPSGGGPASRISVTAVIDIYSSLNHFFPPVVYLSQCAMVSSSISPFSIFRRRFYEHFNISILSIVISLFLE